VPVFSGQFKYTFDAKGRVNIPAPFRIQLQEKREDGSDSHDNLFFHITYGTEPCLYVYPRSEFKVEMDKMGSISNPLMGNVDEDQLKLSRRVMSFAQPVRCDQQGRIVVPKEHIEHAGIENEVLIVGMGNRIELWNPETFKKYI